MTSALSQSSTSIQSSPSAKDTFELHLDENNLSLLLVPDNPQLSTSKVLIETDDIVPNSMQSYIQAKSLKLSKKNTALLKEIAQKQLRLEETIENRFNNESVKQLSHKLFHNHETVLDEEMKEILKEILENDKSCNVKLKELEKKDVSYDRLWNKALYSDYLKLIKNEEEADSEKSNIEEGNNQ
ncbi:8442_t:CDS:2 [Funneliformis geosporum]|uniref:8442_t:CDS:1 n=1 Tax=Funneliformis geosporum TaxID=1117311 RepID=A0A9W4SWN5_9GLOM|nr:8442_t:CDS:2 [Funneliformis geosporum]